MSHTYQTKDEKVRALLGRRIQYRKNGNRNGWTGTIDTVSSDRSAPGGYTVTVQYDNGTRQEYCIEAVQGFGTPVRFEDAAGYLHFIEDREEPWYQYMILDAKTLRRVGSADDAEKAVEIAEGYVRSGNGNTITYSAVAMHEQDLPPVKMTQLGNDQRPKPVVGM